jgi:hypothetical protein
VYARLSLSRFWQAASQALIQVTQIPRDDISAEWFNTAAKWTLGENLEEAIHRRKLPLEVLKRTSIAESIPGVGVEAFRSQ